LIHNKIIQIVATICHILKLKCTKFDIGWGSALYRARGAYSAPPDCYLDFRSCTCNKRERKGSETTEERRKRKSEMGEDKWSQV